MEEHTVIVSDLNEAPLRSLRISSFFFVLVNGIPNMNIPLVVFLVVFLCFHISRLCLLRLSSTEKANQRLRSEILELQPGPPNSWSTLRPCSLCFHDVAMPKMSYSKCVKIVLNVSSIECQNANALRQLRPYKQDSQGSEAMVPKDSGWSQS